jgi:type VI secretion system protein VasG
MPVMMRGVVPALEKHHNVRILDEGLAAAVKLSHRYLPDRQLPDKAVSVLDTACARLSLGQNATPGPASKTLCGRWTICGADRMLEREAAWARIMPSVWPAWRNKRPPPRLRWWS